MKSLQTIDKAVLVNLVNSFDALNRQEDDYIRVIREIIQNKISDYAEKKNASEKSEEEEGMFIEC